MTRARESIAIGLAVALSAVAGCRGGPRASFDSPDPLERVMALAEVAQKDGLNASELQELIKSLDSIDPAARLMAIRTLERETGETFGYRHYDPIYRREAAVDRWVHWWMLREESVVEGTDGEVG